MNAKRTFSKLTKVSASKHAFDGKADPVRPSISWPFGVFYRVVCNKIFACKKAAVGVDSGKEEKRNEGKGSRTEEEEARARGRELPGNPIAIELSV